MIGPTRAISIKTENPYWTKFRGSDHHNERVILLGVKMLGDENTAVKDADFLERIPQEIRNTFTDLQVDAINQSFRRARHGVDIRVSSPLPGGRGYLVLLAGKERRSGERRRLERLHQPLITVTNAITMAIFGVLVFFFVFSLLKIMVS